MGRAGEDGGGGGVGVQVGDAFGGLVRVDGDVSGTGLEDREERDDEVRRSVHEEHDPVLRTDAPADQMTGEPVGAGVEPGVVQLFGCAVVVVGERDGLRGGCRAVGEDVDEGTVRVGVPGAVPLGEDAVPLGVGEDVEVGQRGARRVFEGIDDALGGGVKEPGDECGVERGGRLDVERERPAVVVDGDQQRVGGALPEGEEFRAGRQDRAGAARGVVPVVEHGGEQRCGRPHTARTLGGGERGVFVHHELRELVVHGVERPADVGPRRAGADREGVDEQAGHVARALAGLRTAEEEGAEDDVVASGHGGEDPRPHDVQDRRGAHSGAPGLCAQPGRHRCVEDGAVFRDVAAVAPPFQYAEGGGGFGDVAEEPAEVGAVFLGGRAEQCPADEVTVGAWGGQGAAPAGEYGGGLAQHQVERGVVLGDVVHAQGEQPAAGPGFGGGPGVHQRGAGQVQRLVVVGQEAFDGVRALPQVGFGDGQCGVPVHDLHGVRQAPPGQGGAQDVVPLDHLDQGCEEGVERLRGVEGQDVADDVRVAAVGAVCGVRTRVEPVVEEEPLLKRPEGVDVGDARHAVGQGVGDGAQFVLGEARERDHVRGEAGGVGRDGALGKPYGFGACRRGEPGGRRGGEQGSHVDADALGPETVEQAYGEHGVAAEREEVVVNPDRGQVQDVGEGRAERLLARGRGAAPAAGGALPVRSGERGPVELAVGGERQSLQRYADRGHHVGGQQRGGVLTCPARQLRAGLAGGAGRIAGHHVADEPPVARGAGAEHDGRLSDLPVVQEGGFDLAGFDAEAAQFHLVVRAAQVGEGAVGGAAGPVARAVHARARFEGAGHEARGGRRGPVQVAAGHAGPCHVHLAGHAGRYGPQRVVEDVDADVVEGASHGAAAVRAGHVAGTGVQVEVGDMDGGLGDAVHVHQARAVAVVAGVPVREPRGVERLAAEHDEPQAGVERRGVLTGVGLVELLEGGGGLAEDGDAFTDQEGVEVGRGAGGVVIDDDEPAAGEQGAPQFPDGEVEGVGVEPGPDVVGAEAVPLGGGPQQRRHLGVFDDDALGGAGGARGVDDVGRVLGAQGGAAFVLGERTGVAGGDGGTGLGVVERDPGQAGRGDGVRGRAGGGDQEGGGGVGEEGIGPGGRVPGIDREVRGARLHDREQRGDQRGGALQRHRDPGLRARAAGDEVTREAVRVGVQLGVGEDGRAVADGRRVGVGGGPDGEEVGQGRAGRRGRGVARRGEQGLLFGGREDVDGVQGEVRDVSGLPQNAQEPAGDRLGDGSVEQVRAVVQFHALSGGTALFVESLLDLDVEVVLGQREPGEVGDGFEAGQVDQDPRGVVQGEVDLEEGVPGQ
ncbi:hypothetical protein EES44_18375 [Streptomyces sp. ADI96-15]|nr:hypothetical protein EES44_18375 [Streptomyces sp. ADI96-15]